MDPVTIREDVVVERCRAADLYVILRDAVLLETF